MSNLTCFVNTIISKNNKDLKKKQKRIKEKKKENVWKLFTKDPSSLCRLRLSHKTPVY